MHLDLPDYEANKKEFLIRKFIKKENEVFDYLRKTAKSTKLTKRDFVLSFVYFVDLAVSILNYSY
jgi:hypothetical protein